ncbi:hypothetical protein A2U01_0096399, partial [Trifolium medium]|nr:hypothetical protein [Trifolium medium]
MKEVVRKEVVKLLEA